MEQGSNYTERVTLDSDGAYCWTYDTVAHSNRDQYETMVRICLAVSLPISIIMLVMTWEYGALQALLYALGILALCVGLPALIWKCLPVDPSFRMSETEIEAWPKGRGRNIHAYKGVRQVILRPQVDCIRLRMALGGLNVYVSQPDYDLVKDYIMARVPEGTPCTYE